MAETDPAALVAPTAINGKSTPQSSSEPPSISENSTSPPSTSFSAIKAATYAQSQPSPAAAYPVFTFPSTLPTPPFIDVRGVPNFRSLGGYLSANGTTIVRPNIFYRCAHLSQITPEGLEFMTTKLGVKAVYDLRSGPEVARTTAGVLAAVAAAKQAKQPTNSDSTTTGDTDTSSPTIPFTSPLFQSLRHFTPVYATEDTGPEALARKLSWYSSSASPPSTLPYPYSEGFVNAYRDIATHGSGAYTQIFRHILHRPHDAFVFHCTAGKDRTGVFAALVLRLAGVDDETICWEYAITEPGLGEWRTLFINRMSGGAGLHGVAAGEQSTQQQQQQQQQNTAPETPSKFAAAAAAQGMTREEAARVCGSRASSMRAWLTLVLDGEFRGAENYLLQKCGLSEQEVMRIKRNLVVDLKSLGGEDEQNESGVLVVRPCAIEGWTPDGGVVNS